MGVGFRVWDSEFRVNCHGSCITIDGFVREFTLAKRLYKHFLRDQSGIESSVLGFCGSRCGVESSVFGFCASRFGLESSGFEV